MNETPKGYCDTTTTYDPGNSYWLTKTLALIGDQDYDLYSDLAERFEQTIMANCLAIQQKIDQTIPLTNQLLEEANREMAQLYLSHATSITRRNGGKRQYQNETAFFFDRLILLLTDYLHEID